MQSTPSKASASGIQKLIYDTSKQRSNIHEVEKQLNYFVQQRFTTLHDCISRRAVEPLLEPVPPQQILPTTQPPAPRRENLRSGSISTSTSADASSTVSSPPLDTPPPTLAFDTIPFEIKIAKYLEEYKIYLLKQQTRGVELGQLFGIIDELLSPGLCTLPFPESTQP